MIGINRFNPRKVGLYLSQHKRIIIAAVVIIIAVIAWTSYKSGNSKKTNVVTQKVTYGDIKQVVSCTGNVEPEESVNLSFKNQGQVDQVLVSEGDKVTQGQLLASQVTDDYQLKVDEAQATLESNQASLSKEQSGNRSEEIAQAQANLTQAESNLSLSKTKYEREQQLYQAGADTLENLQQAENDYQVAQQTYASDQAKLEELKNGNLPQDIAAAQAQVKNSTAQLQAAQNDLTSTKITAPFDGSISLINGQAGQFTSGGAAPSTDSSSSNSSSNMFYMTLVSKQLELSCEVNEADITKVKIGQTANFTVDAYSNQTFTATVKSIAAQATTVSNVQMYKVILSVPEKENDLLKAGMPVNVSIVTNSRSHVLTVPLAALDQTGTGVVQATVLKNGVPGKVKIFIGLKDDTAAEVISGLQEGDQVVISTAAASSTSSSSSKSKTSQKNQSSLPGLGGMAGGGGPGPGH